MSDEESLIPRHGGYRNLKSFQIAQLVHDVTVRFCDRYIDRFSRTRDQMVQAARSGVQNIAEGSQASATSKKTELKLTNVARASLEELRLDYEDFLRQRGLPQLAPNHPLLKRFKDRRCASLEEVKGWVTKERALVARHTDRHRLTGTSTDKSQKRGLSVPVGDSPCESMSSPHLPTSALVANAALSLLNLCCYLLDRQLSALAIAFEKEGGFTERLYRIRSQARKRPGRNGIK
jgi:four helix bundle suffix protein